MDRNAIALIARTMLSLYGGQAITELRQRAAAALDAGDEPGFRAWSAILKAVRNRDRTHADTKPGNHTHAH